MKKFIGYSARDAEATLQAYKDLRKLAEPVPCRYEYGDGMPCGRAAVAGTVRCMHHTEAFIIHSMGVGPVE